MPDNDPTDAAVTLRGGLVAVAPRNFSLNKALIELIRALRERRRVTGESCTLASRAAVDRALDTTVQATTEELITIKGLLRQLYMDAAAPQDRMSLAAAIDRRVSALLPEVAIGPVYVTVRGWSEALGEQDLVHLAGGRQRVLPPEDAARLVRDIDGLVIAGQKLGVDVSLPSGKVLPPAPRDDRGARFRRRKTAPWVGEVDDAGQLSLTPQHIARAQAEWLAANRVIDVFCGCGANAIAFALAGCRVIAIESDGTRFGMAQRNAVRHDVARRIHFVHGDATRLLAGLARRNPDAALFLDPPWDRWDLVEALARPLHQAPVVMAKLPAAFDPEGLPYHPAGWRVRCEFDLPAPGEDEARGRFVKMLTAMADAR